MAKKAFDTTFQNFGTTLATVQVLDFINRNNLSASDYHLVPVLKGIDSDGNVISIKLHCIYHAEEKLR